MGKLIENTFLGSVKSAEEMLSIWRQVEIDIAETGQSYRSPGGVEVTLAEIGMVRKQVRHWEKRVLMKRGASGRNYADLTGRENKGNL